MRPAILDKREDKYTVRGGNMNKTLDRVFLRAVKAGDFSVISPLVKDGFDIANFSALHPEIENKFCRCCGEKHISLLKESSEKDNSQEKLLLPTLYHACAKGDLSLIEKLIDQLKYKKEFNKLFEFACERGKINIIRYIINHKFLADRKNTAGLIKACRFGRKDIVKLLLSHNFSFQNKMGKAICQACYSGKLSLVKYLISHGANIHTSRELPLANACASGNIDLVAYLIRHEAKLGKTNSKVMQNALASENLRLVEYLLKLGGTLLDEQEQYIRAFAMNGSMAVFYFLKHHKINFHKYSNKALSFACFLNKLYVVKLLIENGADPKYENNRCISLALLFSNFKLAEYLYLKGAKYACSIYELLPYKERDHGKVNFLLQHDVEISESMHFSFYIASRRGSVKLIKILVNKYFSLSSDFPMSLLWRCIIQAHKAQNIKVLKYLCKKYTLPSKAKVKLAHKLCESSINFTKSLFDNCQLGDIGVQELDKLACEAFFNRKYTIVKELWKVGASKSLFDEFLLLNSADRFNSEGVIFLLQHGISHEGFSDTVIQSLSTIDDVNLLAKIVDEYKLNSKELMQEGFDSACLHGYFKNVKYFLSKGADMNYNDCESFRRAIRYNHFNIYSYLLDSGINLEKYSDKIIEDAASFEHVDFFQLLKKRNLLTRYMINKALRWADERDDADLIDFLVSRKN